MICFNKIFLTKSAAQESSFIHMKQKNTSILLLTIAAFLIAVIGFNYFNNSRIEDPKNEILLRKIGHDVLLSANDKTSKVLPIQIISKNEFQIWFEDKFAFEPDSLINIVQNNISKSTFPKDYTVNVLQCSNESIVYGFHIVADSNKNVITCVGRKMPRNCYFITLKFVSKANGFNYKYFLIVIILLTISVFCLVRLRKVKKTPTTVNKSSFISIGNYSFYFEQNYIQFENEQIVLTPKESKLLHILSLSPNTIIDRSTLQKEIWENEGIIVTRSLDMFISKLRKKLAKDASVTLVNSHGVGYKLEIKN